jgi:hypothetical protein
VFIVGGHWSQLQRYFPPSATMPSASLTAHAGCRLGGGLSGDERRNGVSFPISGPAVIAVSRKLVGVAGFEPATPSSRTWYRYYLAIMAAIFGKGRRTAIESASAKASCQIISGAGLSITNRQVPLDCLRRSSVVRV